MADEHRREQQEEMELVAAGPSIDDVQAQTLLDKHMNRWSTLLDRLK